MDVFLPGPSQFPFASPSFFFFFFLSFCLCDVEFKMTIIEFTFSDISVKRIR